MTSPSRSRFADHLPATGHPSPATSVIPQSSRAGRRGPGARPGSEGQAAVERDDGAGHAAGPVPGQEGDDRRHLLRPQQPAERLLPGKRFRGGQGVEPGALVQHGGGRGPWADRVRGDAGAAKLGRERADEAGHARLRRTVRGEHRQPAGGRGRGDGDEPPPPRLMSSRAASCSAGNCQAGTPPAITPATAIAASSPPQRRSASPTAAASAPASRASATYVTTSPPAASATRSRSTRLPSGYGSAGSSAQQSAATTRHPPAARAPTVAAPTP